MSPTRSILTPRTPVLRRLLSDAGQASGARMVITASKERGGKPSLGASIAMNRLRFPAMLQVTARVALVDLCVAAFTVGLPPRLRVSCCIAREQPYWEKMSQVLTSGRQLKRIGNVDIRD